MTDWSLLQRILFFVVVALCINYLYALALDKWTTFKAPDLAEGFEGSVSETSTNGKGSDNLYTWVTDPQLIYDDFYAGVYDQLCAQTPRTHAKCALLTNIWKKTDGDPKSWTVLDAGCGTGNAALALAKIGCGRVIGLDYAPAMIKQAEQVNLPAAKLTEQQQAALRWRQDSLVNPSAAAAGEFSHIVCFYFTFYYLQDQEQFFRHMNLWTKPGGKLCVEVVNKHKFDPILESASPFLGFSIQKYSKERIHKSKVAFDKFDYEAEFQLTDPRAEFYETFRFKNKHVRRQKHIFMMPNIEKIVAMGKTAGWKYIGYQDLNPLGFEYGYLLMFEK